MWPPEDEEPKADEKQEDEMAPNFAVLCDPKHLKNMQIIWKIVLASEVEEVASSAIRLLVLAHLSVDESFTEEARVEFLSKFKSTIFEQLKEENNPSSKLVLRLNQVIRTLIYESERYGTAGIRPHTSILKGELIDRVLVKFLNFKNAWGQ